METKKKKKKQKSKLVLIPIWIHHVPVDVPDLPIAFVVVHTVRKRCVSEALEAFFFFALRFDCACYPFPSIR